MPSNRPGLRSSRTAATATTSTTLQPPSVTATASSQPKQEEIAILLSGSKLPGLTPSELELLREKQRRLSQTAPTTLKSLPDEPHIHNSLEATLIFAQYEAGTAVCIDKAGWILTCSHCFGDTAEDYEESDKRKWLLFYTGLAVQAECRVWDSKRDLALLKVIAAEENDGISANGLVPDFKFVTPLQSGTLKYKTPILCIGQPGRDDLESTSAMKTKYNLIEVSEGMFRGMVKGVDPQDNSEIGTLKHDAWTYWGHSGAPLLRQKDGALVGLHSSWDDETAMRHGIPHITITEFLRTECATALVTLEGRFGFP